MGSPDQELECAQFAYPPVLALLGSLLRRPQLLRNSEPRAGELAVSPRLRSGGSFCPLPPAWLRRSSPAHFPTHRPLLWQAGARCCWGVTLEDRGEISAVAGCPFFMLLRTASTPSWHSGAAAILVLGGRRENTPISPKSPVKFCRRRLHCSQAAFWCRAVDRCHC
ncbi:hypothetical protein NDU88_004725 [Pleurodeles waltl]|uniref:Uncharacterized protein n=1 Tax=Pleurodeles waltl TaxID=8319 RepID=A0AAV7WT97_PLEWA|nr:hypothetical protein NDU88_004725 [Pleurodeles waltl]